MNNPISYGFDNTYSETDGGGSSVQNSFGLGTNILQRVSLSQNFQRLWTKNEDGDTNERFDGSTNIGGSFLGSRWRGGVSYDIYPEYDIRRYSLNMTRRLKRNLSSNVGVDHTPRTNLTAGRASLSYSGTKLTVTPSVNYDSNQNLGAAVNVSTALGYDPHSQSVTMSGRSLSGSGSISARVFLDNDGDMVFSEDDEWLEYVTIEAIQGGRRAVTDENGQALLTNLPAGRITDVDVQVNSLPDVFWIPARQGVSVIPRPGYVIPLDFPIHMSGEIDGTVYRQEPEGNRVPLRGANIALYNAFDGSEVMSVQTANDGFYVLEKIPPGSYYLQIPPSDAQRFSVSVPPPQKIEIGFDSTIIYANDIILNRGAPTGFAILSDAAQIKEKADIGNITLGSNAVLFNLGEYNSNLLMAVNWVKAKQASPIMRQHGRLLLNPSDSAAISSDDKHILRAVVMLESLDSAQDICTQVARAALPCTVEILTQNFSLAENLAEKSE
jgi:hypothetical protein